MSRIPSSEVSGIFDVAVRTHAVEGYEGAFQSCPLLYDSNQRLVLVHCPVGDSISAFQSCPLLYGSNQRLVLVQCPVGDSISAFQSCPLLYNSNQRLVLVQCPVGDSISSARQSCARSLPVSALPSEF